MSTFWEDGRRFSVWVNGNQYFGFSLIDQGWSLPQGLESFVTFEFGSTREHTFEIEAVSSTHAIGDWETADGAEFLQRFTNFWEMEIQFPQGRSWLVNLSGSKAAGRDWAACVSQIWDSSDGNPFGGSSEANPF
jgi:hypothetical protein